MNTLLPAIVLNRWPKNPGWPLDAPRIAWHDSREILTTQGRALSPEAIREIRHGYLANISYFDAQLGKVLDELDRLQLADKTVIVFWSNHGYHLGEQSLWAQTSNFELDARVPMLIAGPGMKQGSKTDALAELIDLYPTLVEICGLPQPSGLEGTSLVPVLKNPKATVKESALRSTRVRPITIAIRRRHQPRWATRSARTAFVTPNGGTGRPALPRPANYMTTSPIRTKPATSPPIRALPTTSKDPQLYFKTFSCSFIRASAKPRITTIPRHPQCSVFTIAIDPA